MSKMRGGYQIQWLVPESNEKEMEPILLTLHEKGKFKQFEPSLSETFAYVLKGKIIVSLGKNNTMPKKREKQFISVQQKIINLSMTLTECELLLVATESYL